MAAVDAIRGAGAWPRVRPWIRFVILGLWVVWAAAAWWTAPRVSTVEQARADVTADRVVAYEWADSFDDPATDSFWFTPVELTSTGQSTGQVLTWRTGFGRVHYLEVLGYEFSTAGVPTETEALGEAFPLDRGGFSTAWFAPLLGVILALSCLLILVQGPAPGLGTRWFWFWLGGLPFGLGVLLWLRAERPWTEPAPPAPDKKTGQPRRYGGLTGLLLLILGGIVISILVALLRGLPEWLVPNALP
jgi:hypothetical protein